MGSVPLPNTLFSARASPTLDFVSNSLSTLTLVDYKFLKSAKRHVRE
jgi:hypothetical protein